MILREGTRLESFAHQKSFDFLYEPPFHGYTLREFVNFREDFS